ncbi:MAG: hypothetical protein WDO73_20910 [Ignavibacteriota bacterium]
MNRSAATFLASAALLLSQGRPETPADQAAGDAWWAHIKALADDGMEGRLTGSEGYLRAARYVVSQFDSAGLQAAGSDGYYQHVKFDVTHVLADRSAMSLLIGGNAVPLLLGRDAILGSRGSQPQSITAPLVFIGYGLHLPEAKYDDFDSPAVPFASLKGKIVVYINGGAGRPAYGAQILRGGRRPSHMLLPTPVRPDPSPSPRRNPWISHGTALPATPRSRACDSPRIPRMRPSPPAIRRSPTCTARCSPPVSIRPKRRSYSPARATPFWNCWRSPTPKSPCPVSI